MLVVLWQGRADGWHALDRPRMARRHEDGQECDGRACNCSPGSCAIRQSHCCTFLNQHHHNITLQKPARGEARVSFVLQLQPGISRLAGVADNNALQSALRARAKALRAGAGSMNHRISSDFLPLLLRVPHMVGTCCQEHCTGNMAVQCDAT